MTLFQCVLTALGSSLTSELVTRESTFWTEASAIIIMASLRAGGESLGSGSGSEVWGGEFEGLRFKMGGSDSVSGWGSVSGSGSGSVSWGEAYSGFRSKGSDSGSGGEGMFGGMINWIVTVSCWLQLSLKGGVSVMLAENS